MIRFRPRLYKPYKKIGFDLKPFESIVSFISPLTTYDHLITINNPNNYDLIDYQLRIDLSTITIPTGKYPNIALGKLSDGSIYYLPYAFEKSNGEVTRDITQFDTSNIWVRIPRIPANGSINIYLLFENVNRTSEGYDIFDFYDDFERWYGWINYGSGVVYQNCSTFGYCVLVKDRYCDPNGGYKNLGFTIDYPFIYEARLHRRTISGCNADRIGLIDDNGNGYGIAIDHLGGGNPNNLWFDKRTNYSASATLLKSSFGYVTQVWYIIRFYWNNGNMGFYVYDNNWNLLTYATITDTSYNAFTRVYVFGGYPYFVDWIRIRKFADVEPSYSIV